MDKIKLRRGTAAQWTAKNTLLQAGEPGFETDTGKVKIGTGIDNWNALPYFLDEPNLMALIEDISAEGIAGDSAYEVAVDNGFVGTEEEWLASLVGPQGPAGTDGSDGLQGLQGIPGTPGADGSDGADGDSAYQVAVDNGFVGTEAAWLLSLKGATGDTGPAGEAGEPGPPGNDGSPGAPGADGADGVDGVDYTGPTITVASSAPGSPTTGDVWIDTST